MRDSLPNPTTSDELVRQPPPTTIALLHSRRRIFCAVTTTMSFRKENTPLLARNPSESSKYYFLGKSSESYQGGTTNAVRDADGQQVVETVPEGTTEDEFAPRMLSELVSGL